MSDETNNAQPTNGVPDPATTVTPSVAQSATAAEPGASSQLELTEQHIFAALSYLWILVFIPLLTKKDDPYVMYHVAQGLVVFGLGLLGWVLGMFVWILWPIISLLNLGLIILAIVGIINALRHQQKPLPLIGSLAKHIKL
jgi:uncharacterized membrane protein